MEWVTEFSGTTPDGKRRVEYQTLHRAEHSPAERRDRVKVSGRVVHSGWVCDHQGYAEFVRVRDGEPEHTCDPGINYGCDHPDCDGDVGD